MLYIYNTQFVNRMCCILLSANLSVPVLWDIVGKYNQHPLNPYSLVDGPEYGYSGFMGFRRLAKNSIQKMAKKIRKNQKKIWHYILLI